MSNFEIIQKFLQRFAKNDASPVSEALIEKYRPIFPEILLEFWREHGFGVYGNGFIQLINPEKYRQITNMWLMRKDDGTRIPFALTAFGEIFYWRILHNPHSTEENPAVEYDVSFFNPNDSSTGMCTLTLEEFFDEYLQNDAVADQFKMKYHADYEFSDTEDTSLFAKALKRLGVLPPDDIYIFAPALRLGGTDSVKNLHTGSALVQLDILFQLTGEVPYDEQADLFDFYAETQNLISPQDYDRRISELLADAKKTQEAQFYYLAGKLYDHYPVHDESVGDAEEKFRKNKIEALQLHEKAIETQPSNSKYHYAAHKSIVDNYLEADYFKADRYLTQFDLLGGSETEYFKAKMDLAELMQDDDDLIENAQELFALTEDENVFLQAAMSLWAMNATEKAEEYYKKAIRSEQFYIAGLATDRLASAYLSLRQIEKAFSR